MITIYTVTILENWKTGKLEDMEDDDIFAWLDISKKAQAWINAGYSELKKNNDVQELEKTYLIEKQAIELAVADLKKYFGVAH